MASTRQIALAGLYNLRELGGHAHASGTVSVGRLWRSDSLHALEPDSVEALVAQGLATVIDLRQPDEAAAHPGPFAAEDARVAYYNAPIFAGLNLADPEIVEADDPLLALYRRALAERGAQFVAVMRLIAAAPEGAVLFHCTLGKDRTGMVGAMLLKLADVANEDIIADYIETAGNIGPVLNILRARAAENGWDLVRLSRYWRSDAATMAQFLDHIDAEHGGIAAYLLAAGLSDTELQAIRLRLGSPAPAMRQAPPPLPA